MWPVSLHQCELYKRQCFCGSSGSAMGCRCQCFCRHLLLLHSGVGAAKVSNKGFCFFSPPVPSVNFLGSLRESPSWSLLPGVSFLESGVSWSFFHIISV